MQRAAGFNTFSAPVCSKPTINEGSLLVFSTGPFLGERVKYIRLGKQTGRVGRVKEGQGSRLWLNCATMDAGLI